MNLKYIEHLVRKCKSGDNNSKETLAEQFKPLIINLSNKYKIPGYEFMDIVSECYKALFIALEKYEIEKHRFVGFATISIQNSLKTLLRNTKKRKHLEGQEVLIITNGLEDTLKDEEDFEDIICDDDFKCFMKKCFDYLMPEERDFVKFVYFQNKSVRAFAIKNKIKYNQAACKNKTILRKLETIMRGWFCENT